MMGQQDNTIEVLKKFKHIKLISLKKNYGQPGAMFYSKVLKKVSGDYIIILDSDDYLLSNARKKIISTIFKKQKYLELLF